MKSARDNPSGAGHRVWWPRLKPGRTAAVLTALLALQLVPNAGFLPWGGVWMRLQVMDLPFAEGRAKEAVEIFSLQRIRAQVDRQYPNLPEASKRLAVSQAWAQLRTRDSAALERLTRRVAQRLRSEFQYEEHGRRYVYMPGVDSYLYVRQAQDVLSHGDVCDERRAGRCIDDHRLAPNGREQSTTVLPYALALVHRAARVVEPGIPLMQSAGYFPLVFVLLSVIPAFFIGRRMAGDVGGFFAGTLIAIHEAFLSRTKWGYPDTDALNIFVPLMSAWLFLEAFDARRHWARASLAAGAGLLIGLFALTWDGWWYILDFLGATGVLALLALGVQHRRRLVRRQLPPEVRSAVETLVVFVAASAVAVSVALDPGAFLHAPVSPLKEVFALGAAVEPSLWPNVLATVAELQRASFGDIVEGFGPVPLVVALLGLALSTLSRRAHGRRDVKEALLLGLWMTAAVVVTSRGVRFAMFVLPPFALGIGAAFGIAWSWLVHWAGTRLRVAKALLGPALLVLLGLALVLAKVPQHAYDNARANTYSVNDAWWRSLTTIREHSRPDAIVTSWWDYGHQITFFADRRVTFDPSSQQSPRAYWVGRLLVTGDEELSVGILRMLDCGGELAFDKVDRVTRDTVVSVAVLNRILRLRRAAAWEALLASGFSKAQAEEVLGLTHCNPPQAFLVVSDDLVRTAPVWAHFGSWDFVRAALWVELRNLAPQSAVGEMVRRFGVSPVHARRLYEEARALPDARAADAWIAPKPQFFGGPAACVTRERLVLCANGALLDLRTLGASFGLVRPEVVVRVNSGKLARRFQNGGDPRLAVVFVAERDRYRALAASPALASSMFTRLSFTDGRGLTHYELFRSERAVGGGFVRVYAVDWAGRGRG